MSNALFPTLSGLTLDVTKTPEFNTLIQRAVDGTELRGTYMATPIYNIKLQYDVLRDDTTNNELKTLMGFFLARQGSYDSFLFADPDDSVAANMSIGTGNASATQFQIVRTMGNFSETAQNIANAPTIYANGSLTTSYTLASNGLVTFNSPPASGATLTWSGTYYMRCRFAEDSTEFQKFMRQLWEGSVELRGSFASKI